MGSITKTDQPVVILGGFLSADRIYFAMRETLTALTGKHVSVVQTRSVDWLPSVSRAGWAVLLRKLDRTVRAAAQISDTGKITLIGHSAGGVLARLYVSPQPFYGKVFHGHQQVSHLITLGSPHHNRSGLTHGGPMSRWIDRHYPGTACAPRVRYTAVAGEWLCGRSDGSPRERIAYQVYRSIAGRGQVWGDGIVPVSASLLHGARHVTLKGVSHYSVFDDRWYGSAEVIPLWWNLSQEQHEHSASQQPMDFPAP